MKSLIIPGLLMTCQIAVATEVYQTEWHTPVSGITTTEEYAPDRATFEQEVESRSADLTSQPNGGPAWVNRADQPTVTTTRTETLKIDIHGYGVNHSYECQPLTQSADEVALDKLGLE